VPLEDPAVPDVLAPGLDVVFCGINPGLKSGETGFHFAGPGNRFWPSLFAAGFTDRLLLPSEVGLLPRYGCGITNLVSRTTARADELSPAEIVAGRRVLERKLRRIEPRWLAVLGVGAYRIAFEDRRAATGPQGITIGRTRVWLLPNTSGLNAHCRPSDFVEHFRALRDAIRTDAA
jgi:TDG/mug DNA glycosylase family protein